MELLIDVDGVSRTVDVSPHPDGGWWVRLDDGPARHVLGHLLAPGEWDLRIDDRRRGVGAHVDGERVDLQLDGRAWRARAIDARRAALQLGAGGQEGVVSTQMPGVVVRLLVEAGQEVTEGQAVVVVEAMKMENEFKAPVAGTVETLHVAPGDPVDSGAALVTITPA